ncbi:MAG: hypothetical protein O2999_06535 [Nitrospirae bacterium]|nr:hypothetical protein [Nitrospirota bacterium]MDA1303940.1 hypothetical protein [Nitrospirota bacterium]
MTWLRSVMVLLFLVVGVGCASLANSNIVSVPVFTDPPRAKLIVAGRTYYSPDVVKIPRGAGDYILTIEKAGYRPERILLKESLDGFAWYNVFNLGTGLVDDFASGRIYDLDPEIVRVTLVKTSE